MTAHPEPTISVGRLRQNPTDMIRQVKEGAEYVLTDHGVPVARIVPHTRAAWVSTETMLEALRGPVDPTWAADLAELRASEDMKDPFEQ